MLKQFDERNAQTKNKIIPFDDEDRYALDGQVRLKNGFGYMMDLLDGKYFSPPGRYRLDQ